MVEKCGNRRTTCVLEMDCDVMQDTFKQTAAETEFENCIRKRYCLTGELLR